MLNEKVITNTCKCPYSATLGNKTSELSCQWVCQWVSHFPLQRMRGNCTLY